MTLSDIIIGAFDKVTPDYHDIYAAAKEYDVVEWKRRQQLQAAAAGAGGSILPVLSLATMPADMAFLLSRMANCSYGIGSIMGHKADRGFVLEQADLPVILARWAGSGEDLQDAAVAKTAASLVGKIGGLATTQILATKMAEQAGLLVGKKMAGKLGAKLGAKFGAKIATKTAASFIPFLGAAISGGINTFFVGSIAIAAEDWYRIKLAAA